MNLNKCFLCKKLKYTPYSITEVDKSKLTNAFSLCKSCGDGYISNLNQPVKPDLSNAIHIKTAEALKDLLSSMHVTPPCKCGWTSKDFDEFGRMSCPACYDHFKDKLEKVVFPFHGANKHVGKVPKQLMLDKLNKNPIEQIKILKLQYAKALELEEYEKLTDLKTQIDKLNSELLP